MRKSTEAIIKTLLDSDATISATQKANVLSILQNSATPDASPLMTQKEVAYFFRRTRQWVYWMVREKKLHPVQITDGTRRYKRSEVEALAGINQA